MVKVNIIRIHPLIRNEDVKLMRDMYASSYLKYRENPKTWKDIIYKKLRVLNVH